jgi:hypothetical protein
MSGGFNAFDFDPPMKRDDEANARRWRGQLFRGLRTPLVWRDKWKGHYENLHRPRSVTFPICEICDHIVWEWPHFEEEVPQNAICEICFKREQNSQERD